MAGIAVEAPKLTHRGDAVRWHLPVAFAMVLLVQAWVTFTHDAWLDEWQAILLAAQSPDLAALSRNLRYEGHPPFWYLILRAIAPYGDPAWVMRGAAFAIAAATSAIIMFRAPFTLFERVALCLGYLLLVEYGSVARGISIGVMLMFAFVAVRSRAARWAILIMLPMVEVQFAVLAVAGVAMMWRERQWSWAGAALVLLSMAAMLWLVWPAPDVHTAVNLKPTYPIRLGIFLLMFGNLAVPMPIMDGGIYWFGNAPGLAGIVFSGLFLWLGIHTLRRDRWAMLVFLGFFAFTLFMALFVYQLSIRHAGLVAILLVVLAWRAAEGGNRLPPALRAWLVVGAVCGLVVAVHIARVGFDSSERAARYIETHGLAGKMLVSFDDPHAVPVTARLGKPNYNLTKQCNQTFIRWDRKAREWTVPKLESALARTARVYGEYYLISNIQFEAERETQRVAPLLTPVAAFAPGYTGKGFYLYRGGAGATGRTPPACPPLEKLPG